MIVVTVEIHRASKPGSMPDELGRLIICNDGTSRDPKRSSYDIMLGRKGQSLHQILNSPQRRGRVLDHAREAYSVWVLVAKAIISTGFKVKATHDG